jgi:hypothetical protein
VVALNIVRETADRDIPRNTPQKKIDQGWKKRIEEIKKKEMVCKLVGLLK